MDLPIIQPKTAKDFYTLINRFPRVIVEGRDEEVNKAALENKKVEMLVNPEMSFVKDKMDSRNSGLNDVLCKLAAKNNIKIAIDVDYLLRLSNEEKVLKFGKIMQNAMLCRKYHVQQVILDRAGRNEKDLKGFGLCLGMQPGVKVVRI